MPPPPPPTRCLVPLDYLWPTSVEEHGWDALEVEFERSVRYSLTEGHRQVPRSRPSREDLNQSRSEAALREGVTVPAVVRCHEVIEGEKTRAVHGVESYDSWTCERKAPHDVEDNSIIAAAYGTTLEEQQRALQRYEGEKRRDPDPISEKEQVQIALLKSLHEVTDRLSDSTLSGASVADEGYEKEEDWSRDEKAEQETWYFDADKEKGNLEEKEEMGDLREEEEKGNLEQKEEAEPRVDESIGQGKASSTRDLRRRRRRQFCKL